jgi:prolyl-tRNA editing enzyme YbaK/EbsC (Cys-tRNA(Pro) deacylase)
MSLELRPALSRPDLLAKPVAVALAQWPEAVAAEVEVAEINPELADTAAFCEHYDVPMEESANCVIVAGRRGGDSRYAACLVTAVTRADVNGIVRRRLDVRKASFASMDDALAATGMEYGGITPIGLPDDWPVLVDSTVAKQPWIIVGSGIRGSKLLVPGRVLAGLKNTEVIEGLGLPIEPVGPAGPA